MASSVKALCVVSTMHIVLGLLSMTFGVLTAQISPYPYDGMFYMGVWMGAWIVTSGTLGLYNAKEPGNYCRIGSFLGFCLVSIISIFVCAVVLGASVIKHYKFEATVVRDYYKDVLHDHHKEYYKSDEYFKNRNRAGERGLGIYSPLVAILLLDLLTCVVSCFVSRALWKREELESRRHYQLQRQASRPRSAGPHSVAVQPFQQLLGQSPYHQPFLVSFAPIQQSAGTFQYIMSDAGMLDYHMPKLPNYLDVCPDGLQAGTNPRAPYEPQTPSDPPPAYSVTVESAAMATEIEPRNQNVSEVPVEEDPFGDDQPHIEQSQTEASEGVTVTVVYVSPVSQGSSSESSLAEPYDDANMGPVTVEETISTVELRDTTIGPRTDQETDSTVEPRGDTNMGLRADQETSSPVEPRGDTNMGLRADQETSSPVEPRGDTNMGPRTDQETSSIVEPRGETITGSRTDQGSSCSSAVNMECANKSTVVE